jgi:site-specific DNA-methyltransferase (adenine-specific)
MWIYSSGFPKSQDVGRQLHKKQHGKPDKQRFDPAIMIKVSGDQYQHPHNGNIYRALPDINGDRLAVAHEGDKYGTVYEQVIVVDNEWAGWGTCLKPAHEPIALARKPIKGSIRDNVLKHGVGALNIDATRIPYENQKDIDTYLNNKRGPMERGNDEDGKNIRMFNGETGFKAVKREVTVEQDLPELGRFPSNVIGEILQEDYQKYFYCPKVSRAERHIGHEMPPAMFGDMKGAYDDDGQRYAVELDRREGNVGNNHPTVKPIELMKYLIKLITPKGGIVLDPFNGSGSTGCAAVELGFNYIGCELDPKYVEISEKRIEAWLKTLDPIRASGLFEEEE